ncbi:MAG: hypothetical protein R3D90_00020 [Paracoccaceae bacterium]
MRALDAAERLAADKVDVAVRMFRRSSRSIPRRSLPRRPRAGGWW